MKKCAILTMDNLDDFEAYDHLLDEPLLALGWQTQMVSWRQKNVNWDQFDVVLIRTPWDYQDDAQGFVNVLEQIEQSSARLENSLNIVKWNIHKGYLKALQAGNTQIVPTLWPERFDLEAILGAFKQFDCDQIIIKPCISANADDTYWLTEASLIAQADALSSCFNGQDFMVQPFMPAILSEGEYSCFYFNGEYSHAILKTPKENDFRVQEEHGGRLALIEPEEKLFEQATQAIENISKQCKEALPPLYARVDFVRHGEQFALMEAELIEPSLYFNMDEHSAERFAQAFVKRLASI